MSAPKSEKSSERRSNDVANVPPQLSDLHCFTETEGVITTSECPLDPDSLLLSHHPQD